MAVRRPWRCSEIRCEWVTEVTAQMAPGEIGRINASMRHSPRLSVAKSALQAIRCARLHSALIRGRNRRSLLPVGDPDTRLAPDDSSCGSRHDHSGEHASMSGPTDDAPARTGSAFSAQICPSSRHGPPSGARANPSTLIPSTFSPLDEPFTRIDAVSSPLSDPCGRSLPASAGNDSPFGRSGLAFTPSPSPSGRHDEAFGPYGSPFDRHLPPFSPYVSVFSRYHSPFPRYHSASPAYLSRF
jgi:hypothetical protein